jgi:ABC transport system ATP-binding/permease protein
MLNIEHLSKSYGEKQLFKDISFTIQPNDRVGLIGINGTGKSSLLKLIAGLDDPDAGTIVAPKDFTIGYLSQTPELANHLTVMDQIFQSSSPIVQLAKEYEQFLKRFEQDPLNERLQKELSEYQKKMDALNAWDVSAQAKIILFKLGIERLDQKVGELSGGQKKRVALAQVLIETPDLLILDEPTNHLDADSIRWLEEFLAKYPKAVLLVTHDRYFLDRTCNRIIELDHGQIYTYSGNYRAYLEAKAMKEEQESQMLTKKQNLYRKELEWVRRGAKARTTKQKARLHRFDQLKDEINSLRRTEEKLDFQLSGSRLGKKVIEIKNAKKRYDEKIILDGFSLLINPGDRIGIVGKNGSGKSTFLRILTQKEVLDEGELMIGPTVRMAYYQQQHEDMNEQLRMIEYIREEAEVVQLSDGTTISAAQMLERFLFPMHTHGTPIRKLSGGERRRLYLLRLLMSQPNVLLLDEPTNDLDTETLTVLEDYLEDFPGVVITVSHDRYFLDKIADQLLIFNGNGSIDSYIGTYSDYLAVQHAQKVSKKEEQSPPKSSLRPKKEKKKMTYMEKKEWEEIEGNIISVEEEIQVLEQQLHETGTDFEKAQYLMNELETLNQKLEQLYERFDYLSQLVE